MSIYQDKHIKNFYRFLLSFTFILFLSGIVVYLNTANAAKTMLLSHDKAIVTSLIEQDIPEDIIAMAITNTNTGDVGTDFLSKIGITEDSEARFMPFFPQFQKTAVLPVVINILLLSGLLLVGTSFFLWKREQLYKEAANIIELYIDGDYSCHLPQLSEGTIYQIFASVEQLATMLKSKNETDHKAKEFLKNTISDISHQLKTPLAALFMYQEIIENEPDHPDTIKEFSAKTGLALKRMDNLIQSMLKITRLDVGNITFERKSCNLSALIQHSLEELKMRAEIEKKKISLDGSSLETLVCDWEWTSEAIGNLIKNALDHTDSGGEIHISWECTPAMVRITISDNGHGIATEDIYHIFKRFYRSRKSLDRQGIGLGLPLAKSIIEGQGGMISVQSYPHEGTTFTISFPPILQKCKLKFT